MSDLENIKKPLVEDAGGIAELLVGLAVKEAERTGTPIEHVNDELIVKQAYTGKINPNGVDIEHKN